jgi:hypothetical protein
MLLLCFDPFSIYFAVRYAVTTAAVTDFLEKLANATAVTAAAAVTL